MKFEILSDTAIRGVPIAKGKHVELNINDRNDIEDMGLLFHAGRIKLIEEDAPATARRGRPPGS